jgi:hypothetical protein
MPSPTQVQIWWQDGYAEIVEREDEYLVRANICDQVPPGTAPNRFHWNSRWLKGRYQHDDQRTTFGACRVLIDYQKERPQIRFVEDPVFGLLENDSKYGLKHWSGVITLDLFYGREASIHLDGAESGPTAEHHEWFHKFLPNQSAIWQEIEPRIFAYYQEYRKDLGDNDPRIESAHDLRQHLNPGSLALELRTKWDKEPFRIKATFDWDASWDCEHGCRVELHDWSIAHVGGG